MTDLDRAEKFSNRSTACLGDICHLALREATNGGCLSVAEERQLHL
jgi:hypothetical protein